MCLSQALLARKDITWEGDNLFFNWDGPEQCSEDGT